MGLSSSKLGGMSYGYTLALYDVDAHGRRIQQHIFHMIVQEIDLVDIEDAAIAGCQDTRFQGLDSFFDGTSTSNEPTTLSSVAPNGRSITAVFLYFSFIWLV
jgi:hypothetical protein